MAILGGLTAVVATYLLFAAFLSLTGHIAARNVLGDVPLGRAVLVGPIPAAVSFLLQQYYPATVVVAIAADLTVIHLVYRLRWRTAGFVTFIHVVVSILLGSIVVAGYLLFLSAPG